MFSPWQQGYAVAPEMVTGRRSDSGRAARRGGGGGGAEGGLASWGGKKALAKEWQLAGDSRREEAVEGGVKEVTHRT